jgi:hypothetical protein
MSQKSRVRGHRIFKTKLDTVCSNVMPQTIHAVPINWKKRLCVGVGVNGVYIEHMRSPTLTRNYVPEDSSQREISYCESLFLIRGVL